ncbi:MAG: glycosyltransferase family 4 protein [Bacteroidota bacterium]|nr:glycosyltransferase family 4 protein [Bacteroidota bacterium]
MSISKNIAYITVSDPNNRHSWSGTDYYIFATLKKNYKIVDGLGPDEPKLITLFCKAIHGFSLYVFKKRFDYRHSTLYSKACARLFDKKISKKKYDIVVAPAGIASIAYLKTNVPIIFVGDRIIGNAINYHTILNNLWKWSEQQSITTEKLGLKKAKLNILSSHWAADYALNNYKMPKEKFLVMPFGANIDSVPTADFVMNNCIITNECKLLLIGTYWKNKGADIAFNTLKQLLKKGVNASLTVVGCQPDEPIKHEKLTIIPFLNKNTAEGLKKLEELYLSHSFFILPTRFDCTPIVFCEASAFGLPILSANTGGVAGHIEESVNGFLINYDDNGEQYAKKIEEIWQDQKRYLELKQSARDLYDRKLNWDSWATKFIEVTEKISS